MPGRVCPAALSSCFTVEARGNGEGELSKLYAMKRWRRTYRDSRLARRVQDLCGTQIWRGDDTSGRFA